MKESIQQRRKEINEGYLNRKRNLELLLKQNEEAYSRELTQLERECGELGPHRDDGGFCHGCCIDCGMCLG
jgi:hypothetical protein